MGKHVASGFYFGLFRHLFFFEDSFKKATLIVDIEESQKAAFEPCIVLSIATTGACFKAVRFPATNSKRESATVRNISRWVNPLN